MDFFSGRAEYKPTLVNAIKFNLLWKKTNNNLFIDKWDGDPKKTWFKYDGNECLGFKTADISFNLNHGKNDVEFINGRHRTRWQLQNNKSSIAIGLDEQGFKNAKLLGLEPRRV